MRTEGESTENIPVNSNQMEESSRYIYMYVRIISKITKYRNCVCLSFRKVVVLF